MNKLKTLYFEHLEGQKHIFILLETDQKWSRDNEIVIENLLEYNRAVTESEYYCKMWLVPKAGTLSQNRAIVAMYRFKCLF